MKKIIITITPIFLSLSLSASEPSPQKTLGILTKTGLLDREKVISKKEEPSKINASSNKKVLDYLEHKALFAEIFGF